MKQLVIHSLFMLLATMTLAEAGNAQVTLVGGVPFEGKVTEIVEEGISVQTSTGTIQLRWDLVEAADLQSARKKLVQTDDTDSLLAYYNWCYAKGMVEEVLSLNQDLIARGETRQSNPKALVEASMSLSPRASASAVGVPTTIESAKESVEEPEVVDTNEPDEVKETNSAKRDKPAPTKTLGSLKNQEVFVIYDYTNKVGETTTRLPKELEADLVDESATILSKAPKRKSQGWTLKIEKVEMAVNPKRTIEFYGDYARVAFIGSCTVTILSADGKSATLEIKTDSYDHDKWKRDSDGNETRQLNKTNAEKIESSLVKVRREMRREILTFVKQSIASLVDE